MSMTTTNTPGYELLSVCTKYTASDSVRSLSEDDFDFDFDFVERLFVTVLKES